MRTATQGFAFVLAPICGVPLFLFGLAALRSEWPKSQVDWVMFCLAPLAAAGLTSVWAAAVCVRTPNRSLFVVCLTGATSVILLSLGSCLLRFVVRGSTNLFWMLDPTSGGLFLALGVTVSLGILLILCSIAVGALGVLPNNSDLGIRAPAPKTTDRTAMRSNFEIGAGPKTPVPTTTDRAARGSNSEIGAIPQTARLFTPIAIRYSRPKLTICIVCSLSLIVIGISLLRAVPPLPLCIGSSICVFGAVGFVTFFCGLADTRPKLTLNAKGIRDHRIGVFLPWNRILTVTTSTRDGKLLVHFLANAGALQENRIDIAFLDRSVAEIGQLIGRMHRSQTSL